jgi:PST family polysaccharide transporter
MTALPQPASLARNVMWSALAQCWTFSLSVVSITVLARLLSPSEYAVMAVVTPLLAFAMQVQGMGLSTAVVQAPALTKRQLGTLFWLAFAVSVVLVTGLLIAAPWIADWLGDQRIAPALSVAVAAVLLVTVSAQPNALLVRALRFRAIALRNVVSATLGTAVSIILAWRTGSYWSLVAGLLTVHVCNLIGNLIASRWHPSRPGPFAQASGLLRFGLHIWSAHLIAFAARHVDNLIVASATGPRELGLYDRAYQVLLNPLNQAVSPLGQVVMPTLVRSLDEPQRYRMHYWRAVLVLLALLHPALVLAVVNPATFIGLLLGPQWLEAAPLFGWFAGGALVLMFVFTLDWLLVSQGRSAEVLRKELVASVVALTSFAIGIGWGIKGMAVAYVLGQLLIATPHALWLTGRRGPINHRELAARLTPHLVALAAAFAVALGARPVHGD